MLDGAATEDFVCESYERLANVKSAYEIFKFLRSVAESYDYSHFSVIYIPVFGEEQLRRKIVLSNWQPELLRAYDEMKLLSNSPIIKKLRKSHKPLEWELEKLNLERSETELKNSVELFRSFDMHNGVYFPTYDIKGIKGAVSFAGKRAPLQMNEIAVLHIISVFVFKKLSIFLEEEDGNGPSLTKRELECLSWSAQGKTNAEISVILSISENTVSGYITSTCRKLDASNKVHAVAQALRLGLIK